MAREQDANASLPSGPKDLGDFRDDLTAFLDLLQDASLHVVDDQGQALRVASLFQRLRYLKSVRSFHGVSFL
jgi:hypothetical protein